MHTPNVPRRPINYNSAIHTSESLSSRQHTEYRPLRVYVGDLVQVIDPKSHLMGKFGLVAEVHPRNPQFNLIVKIGPIRNPLKFNQVKFCTRLNSNDKNIANENINRENITEDPSKEKKMVNEFIDQLDDDIGNREGMNEKHGTKL